MWTLFIVGLVACGGNEETDAVGPAIAAIDEVPLLTMTAPARGAFTGEDNVLVSGGVQMGSGAISTVEINGTVVESATSAAGLVTFDSELEWEPGINLIGVRIEDENGERAVDGRAIYAGPVHEPGATLTDAVFLQVGSDMLDDDDGVLDDVAALMETLLMDESISDSFVGQPMESDYYELTPTSLSFEDAAVDLWTGTGGLTAEVTFFDVWVDFDVEGVSWYSWVSTDGSAWIDELALTVTLTADGVEVLPTSTVAELTGYGITVDYFPDSLEDYLADWTETTLEEELASTTEEMLESLVGDYLQAFAVDIDFAEGMNLALEVADIDTGTEGLRLTMDVTITGDEAFALPTGAGSLQTEGRAPSWPLDANAPFAVALDDDLMNQLLFAFWSSGALQGFSFSSVEMTGLSGSTLPPPLGPVEEVSLEFGLPAVWGAAVVDDQDAELSMGEFLLRFAREDGETLEFSINVKTGVVMEMVEGDEGAEFGLTLDNRPSEIALEIGVLEYPEGVDPGDLAALIRLLVPPLFGNASAFMPTFPIPTVPLGSFLEGEVFEDVEFELRNPEIEVSSTGWMLMTGELTTD